MEYTDNEKQILSMMDRTDFKHLSKNDVLQYSSKLAQLRPEVATQVIAQFPEMANLLIDGIREYGSIIQDILSSDDASLNQVYQIYQDELENTSNSHSAFIQMASQAMEDASKCLDNPNSTPEERIHALDSEVKIVQMACDQDDHAFKQEEEIRHEASQKDTEQRHSHLAIIKIVGIVIFAVSVVSITSVSNGNLNIKLPRSHS